MQNVKCQDLTPRLLDPAEPGKPNSPRHVDPHYHVDTKPSGTGNKNFTTIKPPGYIPQYGTGFLPGETFPGQIIKIGE